MIFKAGGAYCAIGFYYCRYRSVGGSVESIDAFRWLVCFGFSCSAAADDKGFGVEFLGEIVCQICCRSMVGHNQDVDFQAGIQFQ